MNAFKKALIQYKSETVLIFSLKIRCIYHPFSTRGIYLPFLKKMAKHVMAKKVSFNPNVAYFVTMLLQ